MRKTAVCILTVISITFLCDYSIPNAKDLPDLRGEIIEIEGKAELKVAGSDTWQPLELRTEIRSGDRIRALEGSYADFSVYDQYERNAIIRVSESSSVKPYLIKAELIINIETGKIVFWSRKLNKEVEKFEIRTPNSIIGIEGSHGVVSYDGLTDVTDSYLEVSGGYVVNVNSGQIADLYKGPNYVQVDKKEIAKEKKRRKIYSWDLDGFYGSHAFGIRGLKRKGREYLKYNKSYFTGKYATTINCETGEVIIAPYNEEEGPSFDDGITIYTGQSIRVEDTILVQVAPITTDEDADVPVPPKEKSEEEEEEEKKKEDEEEPIVVEEEVEEEEELELKEQVEESQKDVP